MVDLSHDDIIKLRSQANLSEVTDQLTDLGLTQIAPANRRRL